MAIRVIKYSWTVFYCCFFVDLQITIYSFSHSMAAQINYEIDYQTSRRYTTAEVVDSNHGYSNSSTNDLYQGAKQTRKEEIAKATVVEAQVRNNARMNRFHDCFFVRRSF